MRKTIHLIYRRWTYPDAVYDDIVGAVLTGDEDAEAVLKNLEGQNEHEYWVDEVDVIECE